MDEIPLEMKKTYIVRRQGDLKTLVSAVESLKVDELNRIGHQLAGNARSFGFSELEKIAVELEDLKTSEIASKGAELVDKYREWLRRETATTFGTDERTE